MKLKFPNILFKDYFDYQLQTNTSLLEFILTKQIDKIKFIEKNENNKEVIKKFSEKDFDKLSFSEGTKYIRAISNHIESWNDTTLKTPEKLEEIYKYKLKKPIIVAATEESQDKKDIKIDSLFFQVKTIGDVKHILSSPTNESVKDFFLIATTSLNKISPVVLWNSLSIEDGLFYYTKLYHFFLTG